MISVYTDGSCLGNPGPGGWAFALVELERVWTVCGDESDTTNNRMELTAVIEALKFCEPSRRYLIHTDSKLVMNCAKGEWKRKANTDLWEEFDELSSSLSIEWKWVRGHSGDHYNECVDKLARNAAKNNKIKNVGEE